MKNKFEVLIKKFFETHNENRIEINKNKRLCKIFSNIIHFKDCYLIKEIELIILKNNCINLSIKYGNFEERLEIKNFLKETIFCKSIYIKDFFEYFDITYNILLRNCEKDLKNIEEEISNLINKFYKIWNLNKKIN